MPSIWDPGRHDNLARRLDGLRPDTHPQWGRLTPAAMLAHCASIMRSALGEITVAPKKTPLRLFPLNKLVIYVLPWPKNAPTAPEFIPSPEPDFETAKAGFLSVLARFVQAGPDFAYRPHVAFGPLSPADWGALTLRHIEHHFNQFDL